VTAHGWTLGEACEEFGRAGQPVEEARFAVIVRNLPGLVPVGEARKLPGSRGGRGHALYEIGELQRLHAALAPWLTVQDAPGGTHG